MRLAIIYEVESPKNMGLVIIYEVRSKGDVTCDNERRDYLQTAVSKGKLLAIIYEVKYKLEDAVSDYIPGQISKKDAACDF